MKHVQGDGSKNYMLDDESFLNETMIINTIMDSSQATIYFKDRHSRFILSSRAHAALFGEKDPKTVIGKTDFDYFPKEFAQAAFDVEQRIIATGRPETGIQERLERPDGSVMWLLASKYPLYDEDGEIVGTWGMSRDITALKTAEQSLREVNQQLQEVNEQLHYMSIRDSLSGLLNHGQLFTEIGVHYEMGLTGGRSLILFDIDDFKQINDTYGHLVGDYVINHVGRLLLNAGFEHSRSFRYGGDEFALIVESPEDSQTDTLAKMLQKIFDQNPFIYQGDVIPLTVSIGVASFEEAACAEELVQLADKRLYYCKNSSKKRVCVG